MQNTDLTPEAFKQRILAKYPNAVSSDGRRYSDIDATELTQGAVNAHPDGVTNDGHKYSDFLPQKAAAPVGIPASNPVQDIGIGIDKSLGDTAVMMAQQGTGIANQTIGRVLNAAKGNGFVPLPNSQLTQGIENPDSQAAKSAAASLSSSNGYQTLGKVVGNAGQALFPGGAVRDALEARAVAKSMEQALDIVSPKATAGVIKQAYKTGRTAASGFFRTIGMTPEQTTINAAHAIDGLVKSGAVRAGNTISKNSNAIYKAIGDTAEELMSRLKENDVQPILHTDDLQRLLGEATAKIQASPSMVGNAEESAMRIFRQFQTYLPKTGDITADKLLEARKKLDMWVKADRGGKVFDPATENAMSTGLRAIRQGANDLVAQMHPDVAVKDLLAKQSAMYDALDNLAAKGVKEFGSSFPQRIGTKLTQKFPAIAHGASGLLGGLLPGGAGAYVENKIFGK